ncbi:DUF115 domain-containing protein [Acetobacterium fimetarium]|uniref:DUF115 domain-containing protein n=1 Tax=Acetobacterium fimetarium TaxID=52691 RepID=A0ABR6WXR6_9FIRM|nr:6-hydroxymethylpterin diphosphokinase MptE-like protein [Acetobacterium fimetarium]MBC3805019.1 DUF115 domain-containing protein [Acetobacterium fimetarium]
MLADNIVFLRNNYPSLYEVLNHWKEDNKEKFFIVEESKNNNKIIRFSNEEKNLYLHSKYDPKREAEAIIDKTTENEEIDENTHVIFYGIGLGYHIEAFINRFPQTSFTLYEPSVEVFNHFLDHVNLKKMKNIKDIICEYHVDVMTDYFSNIVRHIDKRTVIIDLPVYSNVFPTQYDQFMMGFKKFIQNTRSSINVDYAFKKRWITNSVDNFKEVLHSPNIMECSDDVFKGKTAILVSAGPSLDFEIENLRQIKENRLAFIFSVGSAINTLISNDIFPDAMCTYDPSEKNQIVFKKVNEMEIASIPMIFGSSVGHEVLQQYHGPKFHMITSQDNVSSFLLKLEDEKELRTVNDAPSIAVVALELLNKLQFSQIILVGQNLAYSGVKQYAGGIDYYKDGIAEQIKDEKDLLKTIDVLGEAVVTTDSFNRMRNQMEAYIKMYNISVINTTKNGAHIEGSTFIPLETVIKNNLKAKIVIGDEFEKLKNTYQYDHTYLEAQFNQLQEKFEIYKKLLTDIRKQLKKLEEAINNNIKQISTIHKKLDGLIEKMEENEYFITIEMPLNRVEYQLLVNTAQRVRLEKSALSKAQGVLKPTVTFFNLLYLDSDLNQTIMTVLTSTVNNYLNESRR